MQFIVRPARIAAFLAAVVGLLTLANVVLLLLKHRWGHDTVFGLVRLFDVNEEANVPSFYSACGLLLCACLLGLIARHTWDQRDRWRRHWAGLSLIFLFLATDEAAQIHEMLDPLLRKLLHASGPLFFAWVIPYSVLMLIFAVTYFRFWWALPARIRWLLGVAGVVYVFGAMGLEFVGSALVSSHGGDAGGIQDWRHAISYSFEEFFEMAGVVIAVYALLCHFEEQRITLSARVSSDPRAAPMTDT